MRKGQKGMLPKNGGGLGTSPMAYKEPPQPLRVSIEEAKNGYTINCSGGKGGYSNQPYIAESWEKVVEVAEEHMTGKKAKAEKEDGAKDD